MDYRKLNLITVGDPYQIPRVDDLLDKVTGPHVVHMLSNIDLKKGFNQVPIQESQHKTSFCMPWVE